SSALKMTHFSICHAFTSHRLLSHAFGRVWVDPPKDFGVMAASRHVASVLVKAAYCSIIAKGSDLRLVTTDRGQLLAHEEADVLTPVVSSHRAPDLIRSSLGQLRPIRELCQGRANYWQSGLMVRV